MKKQIEDEEADYAWVQIMNNARYLLIQKTYLDKGYRINSFLFYTPTEAQAFAEANKHRD